MSCFEQKIQSNVEEDDHIQNARSEIPDVGLLIFRRRQPECFVRSTLALHVKNSAIHRRQIQYKLPE